MISFAMDTTSTSTTDCYRYYSSPTIGGPGFADASSIGSSIRLILGSLGPTVTARLRCLGREMKIININNREKKKGKERRNKIIDLFSLVCELEWG